MLNSKFKLSFRTFAVLALTIGIQAFGMLSGDGRPPSAAAPSGAPAPARSYQATRNTGSRAVTVVFKNSDDGKVVSTAQGRIIGHHKVILDHPIVYTIHSEGSRTIVDIQFPGSKRVRVLESTASTRVCAPDADFTNRARPGDSD